MSHEHFSAFSTGSLHPHYPSVLKENDVSIGTTTCNWPQRLIQNVDRVLFTYFPQNRNVRRVDGNYVIVGFGDSVDFAQGNFRINCGGLSTAATRCSLVVDHLRLL
jgi:hypothetical protein